MVGAIVFDATVFKAVIFKAVIFKAIVLIAMSPKKAWPPAQPYLSRIFASVERSLFSPCFRFLI
jgi:hypothetical protein